MAAEPGEVVRRLSIDEAVKLAMEQNLGIRIQRFDPQIQDTGISLAQSLWKPNFQTTLSRQPETQASTSALCGGSTIDNGTFSASVGLNQTLPWYGGNYTLNWNNRGSRPPTCSAVSARSSARTSTPVHAAAAAQLPDGLDPAAGRAQQEDPRPLRHQSRQRRHADAAQRPERLLGSVLRDQQPEGAAGLAGAVAAVAEGQPEARRDRHDGADRHRAGAGRGREQRVERDRRRSGDQAGAGRPARARPRPGHAGLLERRVRADRRAGVRRARDRRRRRGAQRARQALRRPRREERDRAERHQHQVLQQPDQAGRQRQRRLQPVRRRRHAAQRGRRSDHRSGLRRSSRSARGFGSALGDVLSKPTRPGRSASPSAIRSARTPRTPTWRG